MSAYHNPHYQLLTMRFEAPAGGIARTAHLQVAFQNHDDVTWSIRLNGGTGQEDTGLAGTKVKMEITPYLFWDGSGYDVPAGTPVEMEFTVTDDDSDGVPVVFYNVIPVNVAGEHDVLGSLKIRRIPVANAPDEYAGTFNVSSAFLIPS